MALGSLLKSILDPITRRLEQRGLIDKTLKGVYEVEHLVDFDDLSGAWIGGERERIVFFLFEYPSGRRTYDTLHYGQAARSLAYARHLPEVMQWVYGGPIPRTPLAEPKSENPTGVLPFTVLKGGAV